MNLKSLLREQQRSGTLVSVDVQPAYEENITFDVFEYCDFINNSEFSEVYFLYNGYETLGMDKEDDYIQWLHQYRLNSEILRNASFYDKGYAYFRYCIDQGFMGEQLVSFVRWMWKNDIRDSRDISGEEWPEDISSDIVELLKGNPDMIYIPELMDYIDQNISGSISLCGGGVDECLKEVEIVLLSLNKTYNILHDWTY